MATLTKEIANPDLSEGSRQMACIIFKNFIVNKNNVSTLPKLNKNIAE